MPAEFLKAQREKFEAARMRAITARKGGKGKSKKLMKLDLKSLRAKTQRKLMRKKKKEQMKDFLAEVRARAEEGYSTRQLISSIIPEIGTEIKVATSEVTAALPRQVASRGGPKSSYFYL